MTDPIAAALLAGIATAEAMAEARTLFRQGAGACSGSEWSCSHCDPAPTEADWQTEIRRSRAQ